MNGRGSWVANKKKRREEAFFEGGSLGGFATIVVVMDGSEFRFCLAHIHTHTLGLEVPEEGSSCSVSLQRSE
jgi:hypothetical protein